MTWHKVAVPLHQQKQMVMNTQNTLAFVSSMIASNPSYKTLVDMINEMDLQLMDISLA